MGNCSKCHNSGMMRKPDALANQPLPGKPGAIRGEYTWCTECDKGKRMHRAAVARTEKKQLWIDKQRAKGSRDEG